MRRGGADAMVIITSPGRPAGPRGPATRRSSSASRRRGPTLSGAPVRVRYLRVSHGQRAALLARSKRLSPPERRAVLSRARGLSGCCRQAHRALRGCRGRQRRTGCCPGGFRKRREARAAGRERLFEWLRLGEAFGAVAIPPQALAHRALSEYHCSVRLARICARWQLQCHLRSCYSIDRTLHFTHCTHTHTHMHTHARARARARAHTHTLRNETNEIIIMLVCSRPTAGAGAHRRQTSAEHWNYDSRR